MFHTRNLWECVSFISCGTLIICIVLHYVTNISPIAGIIFPLYISLLFIISILFSFKFIQWALHLNKPVNYVLEDLSKKYPQFLFLYKILPDICIKKTKEPPGECKEYDTNELSVISTVLERKLVSSWYVPYVSQEIGFPFACKQMLDQMIGKAFQVCNKIDTKDLCIDMCTILTSHIKEYKKALKRGETSVETPIESFYNKSQYSYANKNIPSAEHCTNILRIVLKELVPWELWDTPHSELLIRVLSKKLDDFVDATLADPVWINEKLFIVLKGNDVDTEVPKGEIKDEEIRNIRGELNVIEDKEVVTKSNDNLLVSNSAPSFTDLVKKVETEMPNKMEEAVDKVETFHSEPVDIKKSPIMRSRRGRQGRNEVKIYDRIIEGSVKTWDTDVDLQCISLGQDLLASLDGEITLSRLWGQEAETDGSPNTQREKSPQPLWFGEEDAIDIDLDDASQSKETSPLSKDHSPKPTELLKDLQSTVIQAKTKIGDLQVGDVTGVVNQTGDEAAGMMEGLLDFGIAGFKKGLRFTGLSDDNQEPNKALELCRTTQDKMISLITDLGETAAQTLNQKEDNGAIPHLVKQSRVTSQDSVQLSKLQSRPEPSMPIPVIPQSDSPEPQYEEAADLSTSIAKLRSLLQQRDNTPEKNDRGESSERNDQIWWDGAEETRGRTQHHPSTRHVDTATRADEYDLNSERNSPPNQMSNNIQRLDKLFQRTVTGVFNSIKTAVGAEGENERENHPSQRFTEWNYVTTSMDMSVCAAVGRVVGGRRAHTHVDAALDSLHALTSHPSHPSLSAHPASNNYALSDDLEEWCSSYGLCWSALAELAAALGLARAHVLHTLATVVFADIAETVITDWLYDLTSWLRKQVFEVFGQLSASDSVLIEKRLRRQFDKEETCAVIRNKLSDMRVFNEDTMKDAVDLLVSSCSHKQLNKDVVLRCLDMFALHFKNSALLRNPSFDVN